MFDLRWPRRLFSTAISPNDKTLVFGGCDNVFEPGWLNAVSVATGKPFPGFPKKTKYLPASLAFSPDGKRLFWGDIVGATHIVEAGAWREEGTLRIHSEKDDEKYDDTNYYEQYINCLAFSADGKLLATGTNDGRIRLWDVKSGKEVTPRGRSEPDGKIGAEP